MARTEKPKLAIEVNKRSGGKKNAVIAPAKPPVTKRERLRSRLEAANGASLAQLEKEFGWQPHTVRAAISGLRKAGFDVQRGTGDQSSVYRIVRSPAA